jgi:hypothetical protein
MLRRLEEVATNDQEKLQELHEINQERIVKAQEVAETCLHHTQKARQSLIQWEKDNMTLPWVEVVDFDESIRDSAINSVRQCTTTRRNQTGRLLGQEFQLYEDQISYALDSYVDDSQSSLEAVQSYATARF